MSTNESSLPPAGLPRRLGAMFYDSILLFAILLTVGFALRAVTADPAALYSTAYRACQLLVSFAFFGWFWLNGGQTLGMRAWKIRLRSSLGGPVTLWQVMKRFVMSFFCWVFFLGFLWMLIDPKKRTWHDWVSDTEVVLSPQNG